MYPDTSVVLMFYFVYILTKLQSNLHLRPPVCKDHLLIKTTVTGPQDCTFHVIEPEHKDHLCIRDCMLLVHTVVFLYKFHCTTTTGLNLKMVLKREIYLYS